MKRIIVCGLVISLFVVGLLAGQGVYRVLTARDENAAESTGRVDIVWNGNEVTWHGQKTRFDIPDAADVDVSHLEGTTYADQRICVNFLVTLKSEQPLLITKEVYDQIRDGMTYAQVGAVFGGVMTRGEMSKNFCGDIDIVQGKHRMHLRFADGRLSGKFAEGMIQTD